MVNDILLCALATEAMTFIFFSSAPILYLKKYFMACTPFLYSIDQDMHLFECPVCLGFYLSIAIIILYQYFYLSWIKIFFLILISYRLSIVIGNIFLLIAKKFSTSLYSKGGCK
jgi:hypothetical protein